MKVFWMSVVAVEAVMIVGMLLNIAYATWEYARRMKRAGLTFFGNPK